MTTPPDPHQVPDATSHSGGHPVPPPASAPDMSTGPPPPPGGARWPSPPAAPQPQQQQQQQSLDTPATTAWPTATEPPPTPPAVPDPQQALLTAATPPQDRVVATDSSKRDGLSKCPKCGSTDIALNIVHSALQCSFCRFEWSNPNALETYHLDGDPKLVRGVVIGSGSQDIIPDTDVVLTFKCQGCGAEVVIDTNSSMGARCHWCRNTLTVNQQIPNGAVPDMVLPFSVTKEIAIEKINDFVGRRKFYAHPQFKAEFNAENVMGVYLPYMVVDVNGTAAFSGEGEHLTRTYTVKRGEHNETRYDADLYQVVRQFDLAIDDLTIESSQGRLDQRASQNTNNIINSIMPFDVEKSVTYSSHYLTGFASERRDTNLDELVPIATEQAKDIARYQARSTIKFYDRGVRWDHEHLDMVGQRWVSAYLPVWLYSYYERKPNGETFCHYVAVNGRTGETMGSVPINKGRLLLFSALVELLGIILFIIFGVVL